jgi:arylsulfatase A-like enzyme
MVRKSLFLPFQDNQRTVNDGQWKLHIYPQVNHQLLFNLKDDPHEMRNLSDNPKYANELKQMKRVMSAWREFLQDPYPLRSENPSPKKPLYNNDQRVLDRWQPKWIREKYFEGRSDPNHGKK